jgi:CHAD domain-containing protein
MSFEFKRKQSVQKAVRRLGARRIDKSLCALKHCDRLEAVHSVRKDIKQLRALLRLVRDGIPRSDYRRQIEVLRKAASLLAAARDAHVKVNALAGLTRHFHQELAPRSFRKIKSALSADCERRQAGLFNKRVPRKVGQVLNRVSDGFASLELNDSGWRALAPGIKSTYRKGRRGYQLARSEGKPDHFHEWRKRVKDLYYQTGLLHPIWPEQMAAAEAELKRLGELLGDDHDLVLLTDASGIARFENTAPEETVKLLELVGKRHKQLRAESIKLGARFYREKPKVFCKRLKQYWKRWRAQSGSKVSKRSTRTP